MYRCITHLSEVNLKVHKSNIPCSANSQRVKIQIYRLGIEGTHPLTVLVTMVTDK